MEQPAERAKNTLKDWLNSPELQELRKAWRESELQTKTEDQAWWDSLTMDERARAFRQVVSLIYKAEVKERGSYRHAMYDIFEIDYLDGMMCNYMDLHNLIYRGLEYQERDISGDNDNNEQKYDERNN
jgi:hypothetical protein